MIFTNFDCTVTYKDFSVHIGTGSRIRLEDDNELVDEIVLVVDGDVNGDGAVDGFDVYKVNRCINNLDSLFGAFNAAADLTDDGEITIQDYANMLLCVKG